MQDFNSIQKEGHKAPKRHFLKIILNFNLKRLNFRYNLKGRFLLCFLIVSPLYRVIPLIAKGLFIIQKLFKTSHE